MKDIDKFLSQMKNVSTPVKLNEQIIIKVNHLARRKQMINTLLSAAFLPLAAMLFWSVKLLIGELSSSSFIPLLKLLVSDGNHVMSMFSDWGMAIAETLPIHTLTLVTGVLFLMAVLVDIKIKYQLVAIKVKRY